MKNSKEKDTAAWEKILPCKLESSSSMTQVLVEPIIIFAHPISYVDFKMETLIIYSKSIHEAS